MTSDQNQLDKISKDNDFEVAVADQFFMALTDGEIDKKKFELISAIERRADFHKFLIKQNESEAT